MGIHVMNRKDLPSVKEGLALLRERRLSSAVMPECLSSYYYCSWELDMNEWTCGCGYLMVLPAHFGAPEGEGLPMSFPLLTVSCDECSEQRTFKMSVEIDDWHESGGMIWIQDVTPRPPRPVGWRRVPSEE